MNKLGVVTLFSLTILVGGCTSLAPAYRQPEPPIPDRFSNNNDKFDSSELISNFEPVGWRTFFSNQQLQHYIEKSIANNRDYRLAVLKVEEAQQQFRSIQADRYPKVDGYSETSYSGSLKHNSKTQENYDLGLMASLDVDFFGRVKNMSAAEQERFLGSLQAKKSAYILLVSSVAQAYTEEQLAQKQLILAKQTLVSSQRSLRFVEQQLVSGKSNILALAQARSLIELARAAVAQRTSEQSQAQHLLQLLTGEYDEYFVSSKKQLDFFSYEFTLPSNLSSSILLERPDILEAEHILMAANADIGVARAAFFPNVSLTGGLANSSTNLTDLFDLSTGVWKFMPKIELPIFNAGKNKANLSLAEIRKEQAIVQYEQKIQVAFKEVQQTLTIKKNIKDQIKAQQAYLRTQQSILQRAKGLLESGVSVAYLDILDAQRNVFSAQQSLLDMQYLQKKNEIDLFVALGGGWRE